MIQNKVKKMKSHLSAAALFWWHWKSNLEHLPLGKFLLLSYISIIQGQSSLKQNQDHLGIMSGIMFKHRQEMS